MLGIETAPLEALGRLRAIARRDTASPAASPVSCSLGTTPRKNGGWDPTDLWNVDTAVAEDILAVLKLASESRKYPGDLRFEPEIKAIWQLWRGPKP